MAQITESFAPGPKAILTEQLFTKSRLRSLGVEFPIMVAPMVGLSHVAFRQMVRQYIPEGLNVLIFTEMLSSRRIPSEKLDSANSLRRAEDEAFFVPQLLCNEERFIEPSLKKLAEANPWGFDINMGCPVQQTLRHNWGVRLMGDPDYAAEVVRMARRHSKLPLSVKMRGSGNDNEGIEKLLQFTAKIEDAGADWITIHPRPKEKKHSGSANWEIISEVAKVRKIPVVANGDIQTVDDIISLFAKYNADGVMIARAMTARPWLIWQFAEAMGYPHAPKQFAGKRAPRPGSAEENREYFNALLQLHAYLDMYFDDEAYKINKLRFFIATGVKWFQFGHAFWRYMTKGNTFQDLRVRLEDYRDSHEHPMVLRVTH